MEQPDRIRAVPVGTKVLLEPADRIEAGEGRLVDDQGLGVVECRGGSGRVSAVARLPDRLFVGSHPTRPTFSLPG